MLPQELPDGGVGMYTWHRISHLEVREYPHTDGRHFKGLAIIYQCMVTGFQRVFGGPLTLDEMALGELFGPGALEWNSERTRAVLR